MCAIFWKCVQFFLPFNGALYGCQVVFAFLPGTIVALGGRDGPVWLCLIPVSEKVHMRHEALKSTNRNLFQQVCHAMQYSFNAFYIIIISLLTRTVEGSKHVNQYIWCP